MAEPSKRTVRTDANVGESVVYVHNTVTESDRRLHIHRNRAKGWSAYVGFLTHVVLVASPAASHRCFSSRADPNAASPHGAPPGSTTSICSVHGACGGAAASTAIRSAANRTGPAREMPSASFSSVSA